LAHAAVVLAETLGAGSPPGPNTGTGPGPMLVAAGRVAGHIFGVCLGAAVAYAGWRVGRRTGAARALAPCLALMVGIVAARGIGAAPAAQEPEPTVDELVQRVREKAKTLPDDQLHRAFQELPHNRAASTAAALRLVRDPDYDIQHAAVRWVGREAYIPERNAREDVLAERSASVPVLLAIVLDPADSSNDPWDAMDALRRIHLGASEAGPLLKTIDTPADTGLVKRAARLLYDVKPPPEGAVRAFRKLMRSPDADTASLATQWISRIHRKPAEVLDAVRDKDPRARAWALTTLYELVLNRVLTREEVMPLILGATRDPDAKVRLNAIPALVQILPSKESLPHLLRIFRETPDEELRKEVRRQFSLYTNKPGERAALAAQLETMLDDPDVKVRRAALDAFGESWAQEVVPYDRLHALVADDTADFDLARAAAARLKSLNWRNAGPVTRSRIESIASVSGPGGTTQRFLREREPAVPPQTFPPAPAPPAAAISASTASDPPARLTERLTAVAWPLTFIAAGAMALLLLVRLVAPPPAAMAAGPRAA
jgi:hypothetical protein